ncbi:hypothetical protein V5F34_00815 [Xanthobacter autotrophicus]|uniref:hypothetical protein n=1 Tax=Xanthobacter autotrophicus TaxID=280 RepID=UPI00372937D1
MALDIKPVGGYAFPRFRPEKGAKPARKTASERGRQRDEAHLALVRRLPCVASGSMANVEAAHLRFSEDQFGKVSPGRAKPSDEWVLPLCHAEHMRQHAMGERDYWAQLGIEPLKIAQRLYGISAALRASREPEKDIIRHMTGIVERARAEATGEPIGRGK